MCIKETSPALELRVSRSISVQPYKSPLAIKYCSSLLTAKVRTVHGAYLAINISEGVRCAPRMKGFFLVDVDGV